jgi:hypothetical protein
MKNVQYFDITPGCHAMIAEMRTSEPNNIVDDVVTRGTFDWSCCRVQLHQLPHLKLITVRDMPFDDPRHGFDPSHCPDYEGTFEALLEVCSSKPFETARNNNHFETGFWGVAVQFMWEPHNDPRDLTSYDFGFLQRYNMTIVRDSKPWHVMDWEVVERWQDLGIQRSAFVDRTGKGKRNISIASFYWDWSNKEAYC